MGMLFECSDFGMGFFSELERVMFDLDDIAYIRRDCDRMWVVALRRNNGMIRESPKKGMIAKLLSNREKEDYLLVRIDENDYSRLRKALSNMGRIVGDE